MTTALKPLITKAGLAAIWNATSTGVKAEIAFVGLGDQGYTPTFDQPTLRGQVAKYPIAGGEKLSSSLIHLTALVDDNNAFWVRGVGFYLADGTLFAVWSSTGDPLTYKPAGGEVLLAYDLSLEALPADSVTIVSTSAGLNLTLAEPLAAQASVLIAAQLRDVLQQDQITTLELRQKIAGNQISNLLNRMLLAEQAHTETREGLLSAAVANAAAIIALQTVVIRHIHGA